MNTFTHVGVHNLYNGRKVYEWLRSFMQGEQAHGYRGTIDSPRIGAQEVGRLCSPFGVLGLRLPPTKADYEALMGNQRESNRSSLRGDYFVFFTSISLARTHSILLSIYPPERDVSSLLNGNR